MITNIIKKITISFSLALLIGANFAIFSSAMAAQSQDNGWSVTCNYNDVGGFTGGSCTSGGSHACSCPISMKVHTISSNSN